MLPFIFRPYCCAGGLNKFLNVVHKIRVIVLVVLSWWCPGVDPLSIWCQQGAGTRCSPTVLLPTPCWHRARITGGGETDRAPVYMVRGVCRGGDLVVLVLWWWSGGEVVVMC